MSITGAKPASAAPLVERPVHAQVWPHFTSMARFGRIA